MITWDQVDIWPGKEGQAKWKGTGTKENPSDRIQAKGDGSGFFLPRSICCMVGCLPSGSCPRAVPALEGLSNQSWVQAAPGSCWNLVQTLENLSQFRGWGGGRWSIHMQSSLSFPKHIQTPLRNFSQSLTSCSSWAVVKAARLTRSKKPGRDNTGRKSQQLISIFL